MTETAMLVLILCVVFGLLIFLLLRSKKKEAPASKREWKEDMILDRNQKRLYEAMRVYLLDEQNAEFEWRIFQFIDGLSKDALKSRSDVEKQVAKRFKLGDVEAAAKLAKVVGAIQTVKKRSKDSPR